MGAIQKMMIHDLPLLPLIFVVAVSVQLSSMDDDLMVVPFDHDLKRSQLLGDWNLVETRAEIRLDTVFRSDSRTSQLTLADDGTGIYHTFPDSTRRVEWIFQFEPPTILLSLDVDTMIIPPPIDFYRFEIFQNEPDSQIWQQQEMDMNLLADYFQTTWKLKK